MPVAVVAAVLAGACFAVAGMLQQHEAALRPESESLSPRLLLDLARRPLWLAGIGMAFVSYAFQSVALAFGPLSMVQALLVCELLFAVPISARIHHVHVGPQTWIGAGAVGLGLALALWSASPTEGDPSASALGWAVTVGIVGGIATGAVLLGRMMKGVVRASTFALAGGVVMGSQSALLDVTIVHLREGFGTLFGSWQTYLLVLASVVGLVLIQSAFQEGPLAASLPVFDCVEPTVAITIGVLLFGESLTSDPVRIGLAVAGAAVAVTGIWLLDTAPAVKRLHRKQQDEEGDSTEAVA